jgi:hypothetical protein
VAGQAVGDAQAGGVGEEREQLSGPQLALGKQAIDDGLLGDDCRREAGLRRYRSPKEQAEAPHWTGT